MISFKKLKYTVQPEYCRNLEEDKINFNMNLRNNDENSSSKFTNTESSPMGNENFVDAWLEWKPRKWNQGICSFSFLEVTFVYLLLPLLSLLSIQFQYQRIIQRLLKIFRPNLGIRLHYRKQSQSFLAMVTWSRGQWSRGHLSMFMWSCGLVFNVQWSWAENDMKMRKNFSQLINY